MASIGDMLSDLSNFPENHPFLTEALPTIAGAVLMARRGRNGQPTTIGAPLGAGLLAGGQLFGNYVKEKQAAQQTAKQQKLLASTFGAKALPLPDYVQQGGDLKDYRTAHPTEKATTTWEEFKAANPNLPIAEQIAQFRKLGKDAPKPAGLLTGEDAIAAYQIGLGTDPSKYTPADASRLQAQITKNKLAGQKPPTINIGTPISPTDVMRGAGGAPSVLMHGPKGLALTPAPPGTPLPAIKGDNLKIPLPATSKTVGGYIYTLARKPNGTLGYKIANPPGLAAGMFNSAPEWLPGPAMLPRGVVSYTRPDGSVGFASKAP